MLAVVCDARTRDMSSFGKLANYMEYGSGQSMQINTETGEVIARGDMAYSDAILDPRHAVAEMEAVALQNRRIEDPIFHYILAWQEGEQPARAQWEAAVQRTQKAMGMADHQTIAALHTDGTTWHVHVMTSRVHPDTYRAADVWKCHERLDLALREIEHVQGWQESNGLARWKDGQAVLLTKAEKNALREAREARQDTPERGAAKVETYRDAESFAAWAKGEPAKALDAVMKREGATWQDVHGELARFGLTLQRTENGKLAGYTLTGTNEHGKAVHAKASEAFRKHFAGKKARGVTDNKLGEWLMPAGGVAGKEASPPAAVTVEATVYTTAHTRRAPNDRAERKAERDRARVMLKAEYQDYRLAWKRDEQHRRTAEGKQVKSAMAAIATRRRERAASIRRQRLPTELRQVALSVIAAEAIQARAQVRADMAQARKERRAQDYRGFVEERAAEGRTDALAQVRGFRYADQRRAKEGQGEGFGGTAGGRYDPHGPHGFTREQPPELRLSWAVDRKRGHVIYSLGERQAFVDVGRQVRMVKDAGGRIERDQVKVALQLAVQKFGPAIRLTGSEAFRRQAVEVAVASGMRVTFSAGPDEQYRQQLAVGRDAARAGHSAPRNPVRPQHPSQRPPVASVPPPFARGQLRTLGQLGELVSDGGPIARPPRQVDVDHTGQRSSAAIVPSADVSTTLPVPSAAGTPTPSLNDTLQAHLLAQLATGSAPADMPSKPAPIERPTLMVSDADRKKANALASLYVREFRGFAAKRKGKTPGYRDGQGDWSALPAELRERIERFNVLPKERQAMAAEKLQRETAERYARDPEAAKRDRKEQSRGRGHGD